jgi:hypothetical protein
MSEPRKVFEGSIEDQFRRMGIPQELNPNWGEKLHCGPRCSKCAKTFHGCKLSLREQARTEIKEIIREGSSKYTPQFKWNKSILYFFFRVGNNHFRHYGSKLQSMTKTQRDLMRFNWQMMWMEYHIKEVVDVHFKLPGLVRVIFPGLDLSRDQYKFMCKWMEDDFPVVPRCIWKKMLMTSIALGFLVKRLVGPSRFLRVKMFHSIFKQTLVSRRNSSSFFME